MAKQILLLFCLLISCTSETEQIVKEKLGSEEIIFKEVVLDKKIVLGKQDKELYLTSLATSLDSSLFAFDLTKAQIIKFNKNGKRVKSTGREGKGPNEYTVDAYAKLISCNNEAIIAYDWSTPRFQVYDTDLNLEHIVQLNGVPYGITCIGKDRLIVSYSSKEEIQILNTKGVIQNSLNIDVNTLQKTHQNNLRHIVHTTEGILFSYYFESYFVFLDQEKLGVRLMDITYPDNFKFESAILGLSKSKNEVHVFKVDRNPEEPSEKVKLMHVFSESGVYKFSYKVPSQINYLQMISDHEVAAFQDTMSNIIIYDYRTK